MASTEKRCGNCAWYEKPWSGPTYGWCRWIDHHKVRLPEWIRKASTSMGMKHGTECECFEPKEVQVEKL